MRRRRETGAVPEAPAAMSPVAADTRTLPAWRQRWSVGDRIGVALVTGAASLIVLAPLLTPHDARSALATIAEQLRPFP